MAKQNILPMAVIGTGGMGTGHCDAIASKVAETRLVAVCDSYVPNAERAGTRFQVPWFKSVKDLIKSRLAKAVMIATPHTSHAEAAIPCMNAGLHVMTEKPLAETVSKADMMIRVARRRGVIFAVDFQKRMEPAIQAAMAFVRAGHLGELYRTVMISPEYRTQPYYDSGTWRATWKGEGGGVMMNQAPHIMDVFIHLAGMPARVRGFIRTCLHRIEVEDKAEALLTYANGATGYFYCSTNEPPPGQMIELFGDKGKLLLRNDLLECWRYSPGIRKFTYKTKKAWSTPECEKVVFKIPDTKTSHADAIRNFARHILFREPLLVRGDTGLASLELANAIMLSSWTGAEVKLPLNRKDYDQHLDRLRRTSKFRK